MKYVTFDHAIRAEASRVRVIPDFQHAPANINGVGGQKLLDVVAVNRRSSIKAEDAADRCQPAQVAKAHLADRRLILRSVFSPLEPPVDRRRQRTPRD